HSRRQLPEPSISTAWCPPLWSSQHTDIAGIGDSEPVREWQKEEPMVRTRGGLSVIVVMCALLLPSVAAAQQASPSGIAGVVRDTSGAVLPGVTVEASSPALIEKSRNVVTDSEGGYNIVDLHPETDSLHFSLP